MNKLLVFLTVLLVLSCKQGKTEEVVVETNNRTARSSHFLDSLRQMVQKARKDSSTWSNETLQTDLDNTDRRKNGPFTFGIFPVPEYDLIGKGTFRGLGNFGYTGSGKNYKRIEDKTILYNSFFIKKSNLSANRLGNLEDEIFFQIIVLTDSIDTTNFTHSRSEVISRNHPDYLGQGYFKTRNNTIEYAAFITLEGQSYAIVNTRLFNLKLGKTILIAPQKDNSLRSLQIQSPDLSSGEIENYTNKLLKEADIVDFFTGPGNI